MKALSDDLLPWGTAWGAAVAQGQGAVERSAIAEEYRWDLERVYADWQAWDRDCAVIEAELPALSALRGTLGQSPGHLLAALERILDARRRLGVIAVYASMRSDEDTRVGDHTARDGRAATLKVKFAEAVSWFEPELLALPAAVLETWLADEPSLRDYRHFIDDTLRLREHTLAEGEEALLAAAAEMARGAGQVFNALNNADLKFPSITDEQGRQVELTKARYARLSKSPDRGVRASAFVAFQDAYGTVLNTLAANLDANIKNHIFYARARRFDGTLEAALARSAVPVSVYHSLVRAVRSHLDVVHRFTALKKRVLGVDPLLEHDLGVPLFPKAEFKFEYEEAQGLLLEALAPLGPEYLEIVRQAFADRWIDVHENAGKRSGAYSSGSYGTAPYILLNWSHQLRDTFTLAHELGHSGHTYLAAQGQPYVYSDYPIFTAEVASTCNEILLMHHLLARTSQPERRLYLLDHHLNQINDTVVRQTMFAEFEHAVHKAGEEGETWTAEHLNALYLRILCEYWGPAFQPDPERSPRTWCRVPHFYYNYYVYQYATAYAAATAIARRILGGEDGARERYLEMLRSGSSRYPVETLQLAGVDMTTPQPIEDVFFRFQLLLDEVDALLGASGASRAGVSR